MLEDKIEALTKAVEANTAALAKIAGAAKAATGAAAPAKPAGAAAKPAAAKGPKLEDVQKAFGAYLTVEDADERAARKANVVKINEHFGVPKATALPPEKFAEALALLKQFEDGEDPFGGDEPEEGDSLV